MHRWTGRDGSVRHDSIFNGEIYDGQNDHPDWVRPGFNDSLSAWIMPGILPSPLDVSVNGSLALQDMPPIREGLDALHFEIAVDDSERSYLNREDIGDLGQNMAGLCRFRFQDPLGYGTYMRHGEVLVQLTVTYNHSTTNIYTENLLKVASSDTYILHGDPVSEI